MKYDVIIIGGGLAGLTSAIHFARANKKILLLEKKSYPQYKVCGEYVSNEILPYFKQLEIDLREVSPNYVSDFELCSEKGKKVRTQLPLGGFGLSRYRFDEFLYQKALIAGAEVKLKTAADKVEFENDTFRVTTSKGLELEAKLVVGSFGKRSVLDKNLNRPFFKAPAHYMGVKHVFDINYPKDLVGLYNFDGGYCGAVQIEDGRLSMAYLTTHTSVKRYGSLDTFEKEVLSRQPFLNEVFNADRSLLKKPITISNVSFRSKQKVWNHMLMIGDAAGMIAPVCGNGMAMGIHAASIASNLGVDFLDRKISRTAMESTFAKAWNQEFASRLFWGRHLQKFMGRAWRSELALGGLNLLPFLLPNIIKRTHGTAFA